MLDDRRHTGLASGWRKLSVLECNPPLSLCQPGHHHNGNFSHRNLGDYSNDDDTMTQKIVGMLFFCTFSVASNFLMAISSVQNVPAIVRIIRLSRGTEVCFFIVWHFISIQICSTMLKMLLCCNACTPSDS